MRALVPVIAVLALASCDRVFAVGSGHVLGPDGPTDGPPLCVRDDFEDGSVDPIWVVLPSSLSAVEQNGALVIMLVAGVADYAGYRTAATYDMTDRSVQVQVLESVSQVGFVENFLMVQLGPDDQYAIIVGGGTMLFRAIVAGTPSQSPIGYDPGFDHWRIRHDAGAGQVWFDISTDGATWIPRFVTSDGIDPAAVRILLLAGAFQIGNPAPGRARYDNFRLGTDADCAL